MPIPNYEFVPDRGAPRLKINVRGNTILANPTINRGTAFTWPERHALGLAGLLPPGVNTLAEQVRRCYEQYSEQPTEITKYAYLAAVRDRNEVLFYRVLAEHLEEMLPIVYTPTIGDVIERFSHGYHRMRGVFTSVDYPGEVEESLLNYGLDPEQCDLIVVTDSEGILGIGDQGVGGVQICVGKLSVYTAAAGIDPRRVIPVVVDVGTDNMELLNDDFYLGTRHSRTRGRKYDLFIEHFVETATRLFPHAMIHWEDFGAGNAHRILEKYRDRCCTFNDDIQGTAAVVTAAAIAGVKTTGSRMSEQRVVIFGAGTAGVGIADLMRDRMVREGLTPQEANRQFWCLGSKGLITTGLGDAVRPFQRPYARPEEEISSWDLDDSRHISLADVVRNVHPTMLIGTSARAGAFTEKIVREMAAHVDRPIIMPLSNPTSRAEAVPADIVAWTDGRALVATGSPFAPVVHAGKTYQIAQANNALVFPGIGLGVVVSKAERVSDRMISAAAEAVAEIVDVVPPGKALLPSISHLRRVSGTVAIRVAQTAHAEGLSKIEMKDPVQQVYESMWQPVYPKIVLPGQGTSPSTVEDTAVDSEPTDDENTKKPS
ncbi:malate dehydrogenase (oxaloacetate-decarboxylating) [Austwickia chelonae]|uniref:Malolactic enzyme n=1 Tax=Austwickia chelonae NBRC 105200 TaxID=1184607 RepID=K6VRW4_9MICO|nr:NAD-dependent malic enzyme [Austwickia chelonae]GAB78075.1 putative malate dehydrogenase [Austwickia chelonae NBRC 105200]SEV95813.1 malate dehydrogenase (oxaloacetate-decarboxylating) [Austwickia chelonae]